MKSSLVIFCVGICLSIKASSLDDCSKIPVEVNAKISQSSMKPNYTESDKLLFECNHGYSSRRRISYTCTNNKWTKPHNEKCELKRCELPEDIPNGQYNIVNGSSFVFGTTIKYICKEGYQIMTQHDSRTCRDGGWDNRVPVCEEVSCIPETTETNIKVEGLPEYDDIIIRYGHRLTFSCVGRGLMLNGSSQIACQLNGQWSSPFPKCVEATCPLNTTAQDLIIEPNSDGRIKPGNDITFSCPVGLKLNGPSKVSCRDNGEWNMPFPKCEEVKCVASLSANMRSDAKDDEITGSEISVKTGRTITLSCLGKGSKIQGERRITCMHNGNWNFKVPKCTGGKCGRPPSVNNADTTQMAKEEYNPGESVTYQCFKNYILKERQSYSKILTCQDGEWKGNIYCLKPCTVTLEEMDERGLTPRWGGHRKMFCEHQDYVSFACKMGRMRGNERQQCDDGKMTFPKCE